MVLALSSGFVLRNRLEINASKTLQRCSVLFVCDILLVLCAELPYTHRHDSGHV
jgi:hypothetical protein